MKLLPSLALTVSLFAGPALPAQGESTPADGWRSLFDGETLSGWTTTGGRYDGKARWTVEDGCIVGRTGPAGEGGLLYTERYYHSFELELEVRMDWPFDSGVFLRMLPRDRGGRGLQVTLDHRDGGEIGAVYADGFLQHNEDGAKAWRRGEWNRVRVRCVGERPHLQAWVGDTVVTDWRMAADADGFAESGRIGIQVHCAEPGDNAARFRALRVRDLPVFDPDVFAVGDDGALRPLDGAADSGWRPLFDGTTLDAFVAHGGDGSGFAVRDGVLALLVAGEAHELRTRDDFRDFRLRLEFKLARSANSGVFLRADRDRGNPAFSGCEVQLLDDRHWEQDTGTELKPWQLTGSLYGAVAPRVKDALNPLDAWNTLDITFHGARITTRLNGWTLYDLDTCSVVPEQGPAFPDRAATGFLGFQRHAPAGDVQGDAYAWLRNVWVQTR